MTHALVLGKFYPPHLGHHFLIDTAAANADLVTVMVLASDVESIPLADRMAWLATDHAHQAGVRVIGGYDNIPTDYQDPNVWQAHVDIFRAVLADADNDTPWPPIDTLFTSEHYGPELAARLGVKHLHVDPDRHQFPISGTMVRAAPHLHADFLTPTTRAALDLRVVILGAESTGTTTLTAALAEHYRTRPGFGRTQHIPEYGHIYTVSKLIAAHARDVAANRPLTTVDDLVWTDLEFEHIAMRQNELEDEAARDTGLLLFCDTDAWVTSIWQQRYLDHVTPEVAALARTDRALYILTDYHGVPFVQDGVRSEDRVRVEMTAQFETLLRDHPTPHITVTGSLGSRVAQATAVIDEIMATTFAFADPI